MILQSARSSIISALYPTLVALYCSVFIFTIFLCPTVLAVPASIWQFHIDNSPAPSPEDGPPGAANALRNPAYLPVQITGIVCAYLACVLFISTALIFVGRRLRQRAQTSNSTLGVEMLAPSVKLQSYDPSPITPIKQWPTPVSDNDSRFWTSSFGRQETMNNLAWTNPSGGGGGHRHQQQPSIAGSVSTYNESVIQSDRDKAQAEMEKLYAAVMEHEAERESRSAQASEVDASSPHATSPREIPPEFKHLQTNSGAYEPPLSPRQQQQQQEREPLSPREPSRTSSRFSRTPLSLFSSSRASSTASNKSGGGKRRISFRGLPISPPMGSPDLVNSVAYADDVPLSPRVYTPGPPPPTPGRTNLRNIGGAAPPTPRTPGTPRSPPPATQFQPMQPMQSHRGQIQAPPPPPPSNNRAPPPHPLTILTAPSQSSQNTLSTNTSRTPNPLPFRSAAYSTGLSSKDGVPMSAPPTKTTYLERRESILHPAPRTGVPFTPYSPYMPFTPITPITPGRLVSKEERKREKKRGGLKVLGEDDMVLSEAEIWE